MGDGRAFDLPNVLVDGFFGAFETGFEASFSGGDAFCDCSGGVLGDGGADVVFCMG